MTSTAQLGEGAAASDLAEYSRTHQAALTVPGIEVDGLQEELKDKAVVVIRRVRDKLTGLDFYPPGTNGKLHPLDVEAQVDKLIQQATSNELLCLGFFGWCPFW